jgi:hypothetical protein
MQEYKYLKADVNRMDGGMKDGSFVGPLPTP